MEVQGFFGPYSRGQGGRVHFIRGKKFGPQARLGDRRLFGRRWPQADIRNALPFSQAHRIVAALDVDDLTIRQSGAQTRDNCHRMRRRAIVIAQQPQQAIGIGTDDGDFFERLFFQREYAIVFQQDDRFACHFQRQIAMGWRIVFGCGNGGVWDAGRRIEEAEFEAAEVSTRDKARSMSAVVSRFRSTAAAREL